MSGIISYTALGGRSGIIGPVPSFSAHPASDQNNFAVDSNVQIVWGTEVFAVGINFASNTFTAPVTGKYYLSINMTINNMQEASSYYQISLVTNNKTFYTYFDPAMLNNAGSGANTLAYSVIAHLDSGHTAYVTIRFSAGGAHADIDTESYFTGHFLG